MIQSLISGVQAPAATRPGAEAATAPGEGERSEIAKRFEQMLWAEMLSHAGLEKAFTQSGGEGASAFSRYIVEAIAKDMAEKHSLGIGDKVDLIVADTALKAEEGAR